MKDEKKNYEKKKTKKSVRARILDSYKINIKKNLYRKYYVRLHQLEKSLKYTSTKIANEDILNIFKNKGKRYLLDAGCGDCLFLEQAKKLGFNAEGFDNNDELLNVCKKKGFNVVKANFNFKLPYPDKKFEGIYCANVLEHLEEPDFAIFELMRILKKNGVLILSIPEADSLFWSDWTHVRPFTKQTIKSLMSTLTIKNYTIYKRHFPFFVKWWNNPIIRFMNIVFKHGILADGFDFISEKIFKVRRHDLVVIIEK
ncbi:MAG: class I SAM-dependent methyltransferase [Candidatus Woesearchaeota archaeon]